MNELFAGYANYASVESIVDERSIAHHHADPEARSVTISYSLTWSSGASFTVSI
jgi:hypothetical protein